MARIAWMSFVTVAIGAAAIASCDADGTSQLPRPPLPDGGGGTLVPPGDGGLDADTGELPADGGDAGVAEVLVAITANPQGGAAPGGEVEALLQTFAAGVRGVVVSRTLRELDDPGLAALAAEGQLLGEHGKEVLFNLAVVDRLEDGRPEELAAIPWDSPLALTRLELTIDAAVDAFGPSLRYVTLGRDVDRYLVAHPDERSAFEVYALHACAYARRLPAADGGASTLAAGVAFSYAGATTPDASWTALRSGCSIAPVAWQAAHDAEDPSVPAALDALAAAAQDRPVVLQALGAPSVGSDRSPETQRQFFAAFFGALAPRRQTFAFVNVFQLHDLDAVACAARAVAQDEDPTGASALGYCSLGLFTAKGEEKPAWAEVLNGTAAFASP